MRELRDNLIEKIRAGKRLFPGIIGYDESVIPQIINAILSQHNFVILGLRGQAKTRILRALVDLLDDKLPVVPGCEINDDPLAPLCGTCRTRVREEGDALPVAWLPRAHRFVEKLATPDVTIADMIGDIDPIKAARGGLRLSDELKGTDNVARDLIRSAVSPVFAGWFDGVDCHPVVEWFEMGAHSRSVI